jgi:hypothetical protein
MVLAALLMEEDEWSRHDQLGPQPRRDGAEVNATVVTRETREPRPYLCDPRRQLVLLADDLNFDHLPASGRGLVARGSNFADSEAMTNQPPRRFPPPGAR